MILIDGPFGDYEKLVKEGHKTVNFYVNDEVISIYYLVLIVVYRSWCNLPFYLTNI